MVRCTMPRSCSTSSSSRSATGSPHPGHSECSPSSSDGLASATRRPDSGGTLVSTRETTSSTMGRLAVIVHHLEYAVPDHRSVHQFSIGEPGFVDAHAPDGAHHLPVHRVEPYVVDHLTGVELKH